MKVLLCLLLSLPLLASADAFYQCRDQWGRAVFSDQPCGKDAQPGDIDGPPMMGGTNLLGGFTKEQIDAQTDAIVTRDNNQRLQNKIDHQQQLIDQARRRMATDIAELDRRLTYANNNLAGAIYGRQLAQEKQATVDRYNAEIDQRQRLIDEYRSQMK